MAECYGESKHFFEVCPEPQSAQQVLGKRACDACLGCLETTAFTDQLTGLPNRHALQAEFFDLKKQGIPIGGITVDLTNFKTVNDKLGHNLGDMFLTYTGIVLKGKVRQRKPITDITYAARRGGDEFALLVKMLDGRGEPVPSTSHNSILLAITRRLEKAYSEDPIIEDYNREVSPEKPLGLRMGYSSGKSLDLESLLAGADTKGKVSRGKPKPELVDIAAVLGKKLATKLHPTGRAIEVAHP